MLRLQARLLSGPPRTPAAYPHVTHSSARHPARPPDTQVRIPGPRWNEDSSPCGAASLPRRRSSAQPCARPLETPVLPRRCVRPPSHCPGSGFRAFPPRCRTSSAPAPGAPTSRAPSTGCSSRRTRCALLPRVNRRTAHASPRPRARERCAGRVLRESHRPPALAAPPGAPSPDAAAEGRVRGAGGGLPRGAPPAGPLPPDTPRAPHRGARTRAALPQPLPRLAVRRGSPTDSLSHLLLSPALLIPTPPAPLPPPPTTTHVSGASGPRRGALRPALMAPPGAERNARALHQPQLAQRRGPALVLGAPEGRSRGGGGADRRLPRALLPGGVRGAGAAAAAAPGPHPRPPACARVLSRPCKRRRLRGAALGRPAGALPEEPEGERGAGRP